MAKGTRIGQQYPYGGRAEARHRWMYRPLFLALTLAVLVTACTGNEQPDDAAPRLRSRPAPEEPADQGEGGDTSVEGNEDSAAPAEPTDKFQRLDPSQFGNSSTEIVIEDAVSLDAEAWLVVGGLEDGKARTIAPIVGVLSPTDPERNLQIELPTDEAERASALGVSVSGDTVRVVGNTERGARSTAVVWTSDVSLQSWERDELPMPGRTSARAFELIERADVSYVLGSENIDGFDQPLIWRRSGDRWETIDAESTPDRNVLAVDGVIVDSGLIAVGTSSGAFGDPRPVIWSERGGDLATAAGTGLPSGGVLHSIVEGPDGELIAAGASTSDAISTPMVATAGDVDDRWAVQTSDIDIASWTSFDGLQFREVTFDGGDLVATLTNPVVQQLSRSSDGGQTWNRVGDLGSASGNFLPANGLAVNEAGQILVAGGDVAMVYQDDGWSSITDQQISPSQLGAFGATDVVAGPDGFFVGGGRSGRSADGVEYEAVVWQSPDGVSWGRPPLTDPTLFSIYDLLLDSDDRPAALKGGGGFFSSAGIERPGASGRWGSTTLDIGSAFLLHAVAGPGGSIIAGGVRPDPDPEVDVLDPLFVIIEPDDSIREIPLTDSPIDPETNAEVACLAGVTGDLMAVVEWGDGQVGIVAGPNGERWSGVATTGLGGDLDISSCHRSADGGWLLAGQNATGQPIVATSPDSARWSVEAIADRGSVLGIDEVDGKTYLTGWTASPGRDRTDATIWRMAEDGWEPITDTGLESDGFARSTSVSGLAAADGVVVAIGTDRGRAGAWVATTDVLTQ